MKEKLSLALICLFGIKPAVIVYIPLADKFYTDKSETIEMIKEKY